VRADKNKQEKSDLAWGVMFDHHIGNACFFAHLKTSAYFKAKEIHGLWL
jgi:hypothetical protein